MHVIARYGGTFVLLNRVYCTQAVHFLPSVLIRYVLHAELYHGLITSSVFCFIPLSCQTRDVVAVHPVVPDIIQP